MGLKWDLNGTRMGLKWGLNEVQMGLDSNGIHMGLKWDLNMTQIDLNYNDKKVIIDKMIKMATGRKRESNGIRTGLK